MYEAEVRMSFKLKLTRSGDSFFFFLEKHELHLLFISMKTGG